MVIDKIPLDRQNSGTLSREVSTLRERDKYDEINKIHSIFGSNSSNNYNNFTQTSSSSSSSSSGSSGSSHSSKSNTIQPIIHLADLEFKDEKLRILKEAITFKGIYAIYLFIYLFIIA